MSVSQRSVTFVPGEVLQGSRAFPYDVRVLSRDDDLADILKLRRDAYRAQGWTEALDVSDAADGAPQSVQIAAFTDHACTCAVRMTFKAWTEPVSVLPCAPFFPALQSAGLRKLSIAEMSHLVIDAQIADPAHRLVFHSAMVRAALLAVQAARVAMLVAASQASQVEFYTKLLRFHVIGLPAIYPPAKDVMTLVGANTIGAGRRSLERVAFFRTTPGEVASMREALVRCLGDAPHTRVLAASVQSPGA